MKRSLFIVVLIPAMFFAMSAPTGCATTTNDSTVTRIEASDVQSRMGGKHAARTACIDVRMREEYLAGHIPGAVNIGLRDAAAGKTAALRSYTTIIICGRNPGSGSAMALAKKLTAEGYTDVHLFDGGIDAWRRAGLPIERGDRSSRDSTQRKTPRKTR